MMASSSSSSAVFFLLFMAAGSVVTTVTARDLYGTNVLYSGQQLKKLEMLSGSGDHIFDLRDLSNYCQFCIRKNDVLSWCTHVLHGKGFDCAIALQRDGDLVVYGDSNVRFWSSKTAGKRGDYILLLQDNGTLVLYGDPIWTSREWPPLIISSPLLPLPLSQQPDLALPPRAARKSPVPSNGRYDQNVLYEGEHLIVNEELRSKSYRLVMLPDCNLVLYSAFTTIWQTYTAGKATNCKLEMRRWGNLVITNEWDDRVWSSGIARGDGDYILILQDDGNLVVYSKALWANTNDVGSGRTNQIAMVVNGNGND